MFAQDCADLCGDIESQVTGRRLLIVGGAGSIGAATLIEILEFHPAAVAVLDPSENNLAELVRTIRSLAKPFDGTFDVQPLDYGSPLAESWMAVQTPFDLVLSFAALKHVRSERDVFSLLRMLEVNLVKADRFLAALRRQGHGLKGVFFVSTDKAANPVSLMGASKRVMELLLWAHAEPGAPAGFLGGGFAPCLPRVTTTRFANVAFSDGSLPWSFLQRLEKRQPLAAPADVRRYLVSPSEAGQLCVLAALTCPHRHLLVPTLSPSRDLVSFTDIAAATLRAHGFEPAWYDDADAARQAVEREAAGGRYPVLRTVSDTSGEKEIEEFIGEDEQEIDVGLRSAKAVAAGALDMAALADLLGIVERGCARASAFRKEDLVAALIRLVPLMHHRETGRSLDGKM